MIIFLFNHYFPDSSGFGRRCQREIESLSQVDEVMVVCRQRDNQSLHDSYPSRYKKVQIKRFKASSEVVLRPENYKPNGLYELKRNLDVMINLAWTLLQTIRGLGGQNINLCCVTSPLTIPLLGLLFSKFFNIKAFLVSFHDLEPELAMHMKKLPYNNWLVQLELKLEAIVCHGYRKVLVTSEGQSQRLITRNKLKRSKIMVVPNTTDTLSLQNFKVEPIFAAKDFVLVYMSTLSFDYTIDGLKEFLLELSKYRKKLPQLKVLIVGGGEGLPAVKSLIKAENLVEIVKFTGSVDNPIPFIKQASTAIIPWKKDIMTETMLPTKLFEYLSLGIPVIAPNFGEFKRILKHKESALLYDSTKEIFSFIQLLLNTKKNEQEIGKKGKNLFLSNYSLGLINKQFISFYQL